jgi:hypothetical protein
MNQEMNPENPPQNAVPGLRLGFPSVKNILTAITTWRFCATGLDGQEETTLMENAFNVKGIFH